ncbi:MAG: hypothetical protein JST00_29445 [Deltaproteobacteria bacterium]|nr:hypothetical protein [Deltaproteobacteria bacterium]
MRPLVVALVLSSSLAFACSGPAPRGYAGPTVLVSSTDRAVCEQIELACEAYERTSELGRECHDVARMPSTSEASCIARKAECLAACPPR